MHKDTGSAKVSDPEAGPECPRLLCTTCQSPRQMQDFHPSILARTRATCKQCITAKNRRFFAGNLEVYLAAESRRWVKILGVVALIAVIGQGFLGGYRVKLNSTHLAAVHGCTGQAFFALMVTLCVITSRKWKGSEVNTHEISSLLPRTTATLFLIYMQVLIGAWLRHFGSPAALGAHAGLAVAVSLQAMMTVWGVERRREFFPELVRPARALGLLLIAQLAFGILAWWFLRPFDGIARYVTTPQALIRTCHQANGALLLASATVLVLNAHRSSLARLRESHKKPSLSRGEAMA